MRKINNIFIYLATVMLLITSCQEEEKISHTLSSDPSTFVAPAFTNPASGSAILEFDNANEVFETFSWSAADYGLTLPVRYTLEVADNDAFTDALVPGDNLTSTTASYTVTQANAWALNMGFEPFVESTIYIRVTAEVPEVDDVVQTVSTTITRTITPYITEFGPIWMIGAGVGGWDWGQAVQVNGTAPFVWEVVAEFTAEGDANFRFFEVNGVWESTSYNFTFFDGGTVDSNLILNPNDSDNNFKFVGMTGYYRITVNVKDLVVSMEALPGQPSLYIVGSGAPLAGWSWDTAIGMDWIRDGVFETTTEFLMRDGDNEAAFRLFTADGDWGSGLNYPHYQDLEYEIDSKLINAMDGDSNFALGAESGTYKLVINDIDKTIILAEAGTAGPPKYLVGSGVPAAGWDWVNAVELVQVESGLFVGDTEFVTLDGNGDAAAFRVFGANGDWDSGVNYPTYVADGYTIDPRFIDADDNDNNFKLNGVDGVYRFTLDENNKVITLSFVPILGAESKYLVGSGVPASGWDWTTPVELIEVASGVYKTYTEFVNLDGNGDVAAFRVFGLFNDWGSGVNYPTYVADGYTVDAQFIDAADDDNNFRFNGTDGTYIFTLDENAKTITLE